MKKRVLILLSCLLLCACLFPALALADMSGQYGDDLYWSIDEATGTLTITGSGATTATSTAAC